MLTPPETAKLAALKKASQSFVVMRQLAKRFGGILHGDNPAKLARWHHDAQHPELRSMRQFARTMSRDIEDVRNATAEPWSSGQAEGQINRLKTLERTMYGRVGIELLRERMLPLEPAGCT